MSGALPRIWVLLGSRVGDNNQLLALAEALGLPFETRTMAYRTLWGPILRLFPARPLLLDRRSRRTLQPPWPDLVIGIGRRSVAVAQWIKAQSGGRTKLVRLGNPRRDPRQFDLVITTRQYPVPRHPNVIVLPVAMGRHRNARPTPEERDLLDRLPCPHFLMSLGGVTRFWTFDEAVLTMAVATLAKRAERVGGSLIVVGSPRTPRAVIDHLEAALHGKTHCTFIRDAAVRYPVLVGDADEHFVTADSVSMISEAVLTGKPVGLIPAQLDSEGQRKLGSEAGTSSIRDLRRFWADLEQQGLVGSVQAPRNRKVDDPVAIAAGAVRRLLGNRLE